MNLSKNEIITLKHLSDGQQHNLPPSGLSDAQFYATLKTLKERGMVYAAFEEGGAVVSSQIEREGKAVLDDMLDEEKRIKKQVLKEYNITFDQYEILKRTKNDGRLPLSYENMDSETYKKTIWSPLLHHNHLDREDNDNGSFHIAITHSGKRLLEDIDKEVVYRLSKNDGENCNDESKIGVHNDLQTFEEDEQEIIKHLTDICYGTKDNAIVYYTKIRRLRKDMDVVKYTAECVVNTRIVSDMSCNRDLYEVLKEYGLYTSSENNWNKRLKEQMENLQKTE